MRHILIVCLTLLNVVVSALRPPPIGARYRETLKFPLLGHQTISLHIASKYRASIAMEGIITHEEELDYTICPLGNTVEFTLSDYLDHIMHRYRCRIQEAWYDAERDQACITVRLDFLRLHRKIRMSRVPTPTSGMKTRLSNAGYTVRKIFNI